MWVAQPSIYNKFESCHILTSEPSSTYGNFLFVFRNQPKNMYPLSSAVNITILFQKVQTCHMLASRM